MAHRLNAMRQAVISIPILGCCSLILTMLATGCSSFNCEWKAATVHAPLDEITGRWEGSWHSDVNGHHGRMRCVVSQSVDNEYRAQYRATYWKCLRFSYVAVMRIEMRSGEVREFEGEADLGWWGGGVFRYRGQVTPTNFDSTYDSKYDHGKFQLRRPEQVLKDSGHSGPDEIVGRASSRVTRAARCASNGVAETDWQ